MFQTNAPCFHSTIDTKNICVALAVKAGLVPLISQQASSLFRVPNSLSVAAIFIFSRSGAKLSKQKILCPNFYLMSKGLNI